MFGVSMWEILVVLALLVVLVGPDRLPDLAKSLGKALGKVRRSVEDIKEQTGLDEDLDFLEDLRDVGRQVSEGMTVDSKEQGLQNRPTPHKTQLKKGRQKISGPKKKATGHRPNAQGPKTDSTKTVGISDGNGTRTRGGPQQTTKEETEGD